MTPIYEDLCLLIGRDGADAMVARYGGLSIRIPSTFPPASPRGQELLDLLGWDRAQQLAQHYARETVYIPSQVAVRSAMRERAELVVTLAEQGMRPGEIAAELARRDPGCRPNYRWVTRTLAAARESGRLPARPARPGEAGDDNPFPTSTLTRSRP